jgi:FixJ family two-component response regulator
MAMMSRMGSSMADAPATVIVIDDDPDVREALGSLLRSVGLRADLHGSVAEFLKARRPDGPTCLVLDVRLPGQGGLDFQRELSKAGLRLPIIFITGHGDIPMSVEAMKGGAIEFMTKPLRDQDLLDAIQLGLERHRTWREQEKTMALLHARFDSLTQRERDVMTLVITGRLNQADRRRTRRQRDHGEGPSRPGDAKDGGYVLGRSGADGREIEGRGRAPLDPSRSIDRRPCQRSRLAKFASAGKALVPSMPRPSKPFGRKMRMRASTPKTATSL